MKKNLFGAALLAVTSLSFATPAAAELKLHLGGHFKGYGVYVDEDAATAGQRDFEFRKDTEIHFTGETTLDNGLTVGVHVEQSVERSQNNNESYAYFSGGWGRVNFGNEDGAAYLLQVAAPSADSNIDGMRTYIRGYQSDEMLDYDHAFFGNAPDSFRRTNRLTYLSPKFNGLQLGASYAPHQRGVSPNGGIAPMDNFGSEDIWEAAARWDGSLSGVGLSIGSGYSQSKAMTFGNNSVIMWNTGATLTWRVFSIGAAYLSEDQTDHNMGGAIDAKTYVVGAAWDHGPYHVGASYLRRDNKSPSTSFDNHKTSIGAGYAYGPGMSFRAAASWGETRFLAIDEQDFTQLTLGTDIAF